MLQLSRQLSYQILTSPRVTGAGPFVAKSVIHLINNNNQSFKVDLPRRSVLKVREACITACNKDFKYLKTGQESINNFTFDQLTSEVGTSFIVSATKSNAHYHILRVSGSDVWRFPNPETLVAWTGENPVYETTPSAYVMNGDSDIVLTGTNGLYKVYLDSSESILVSPNCVIGFNALRHSDVSHDVCMDHKNRELTSSNYHYAEWPSFHSLHRFWNSALKRNTLRNTLDFIKFTGPGDIIVTV